MIVKLNAFIQFSEIAYTIADASGLGGVCDALGAGRLSYGSTAATRAAVAEGNVIVESSLRSLQETWSVFGPSLSEPNLALVLRTNVAPVAALRRQMPAAQVVWSGPNLEGSFLRATKEMVRDLLHRVQEELLFVKYLITIQNNFKSIIKEFIALLAKAVTRRVVLRVIFDERARPDGRDDRHILLSAWSINVLFLKILNWFFPLDDQDLKLHAKVLVADRYDALVTFTNFISYTMNRNMEMGVRFACDPVADIAQHFDLLEAHSVFEPYKKRC